MQEGTNSFGQFIGFKKLLLTTILPISSPDFFFKFFIFIFAFIFFKILIKPIRVGLQLMFLINNFDPAVNKARVIKGAADDGSPGISRLKALDKFSCPFNEIKLPFFNFFDFYISFDSS